MASILGRAALLRGPSTARFAPAAGTAVRGFAGSAAGIPQFTPVPITKRVDADSVTVGGGTAKKPYTWEKHRSPFKRAGKILRELNIEQMVNTEAEKAIPCFRAGDAIEVVYSRSTKTAAEITVRGMVIARANRGFGSTFKLLCNLEGDSVELWFPLYSPLIRRIKMIQESFLHRGERRTRRAKLFYLRDRPLALYTVKEGFAHEMDRRRARTARIEEEAAAAAANRVDEGPESKA